MRIIRGKFRGRRLMPPSGLPVRPTTDMAREGIFNIIESHINLEGLTVLDLYAGTGAISFEFLSRGCRYITTVDVNSRCLAYIAKIKKEWGIVEMDILKRYAIRYLSKTDGSWDIIFADPPYDSPDIEKLPGLVLEKEVLSPGGWFILEHGASHDFSSHTGFHLVRNYSQVHFSIFCKATEMQDQI